MSRSVIIVLASICPFCAFLGYLTPSLIDEYAAGQPAVAGKAYAVNVLGCILGPLFACYVLLPWMSERSAIDSSQPALLGFLFPLREIPDSIGSAGDSDWRRACSGLVLVLRRRF